jgi:MoxR-like ATPase
MHHPRVQTFINHLGSAPASPPHITLEPSSASSFVLTRNAKLVRIVDAATRQGPELELLPASSPQLVPQAYLAHFANGERGLTQHSLALFQFLMKKELLNQDAFLIGAPGPLKRRLCLAYAELAQREVEVLTITQDTTVNDITQRREILGGTSYFEDGPAVKAALHGRILVLDGIEKAERNVLSIINNLCENREALLEDGRFLTAPQRFDALMRDPTVNRARMVEAGGHAAASVGDVRLVRVSERFRVFCLGAPVPTFEGRALDPPFRSRFQCVDVSRPDKYYAEDAGFPPAALDASRRLQLACDTMQAAARVGVEGLAVRALKRTSFPLEFGPLARRLVAQLPAVPLVTVAAALFPVPLLASTDAGLRGLAVEALERARVGSPQALALMGPRFSSALGYVLTGVGRGGRGTATFSLEGAPDVVLAVAVGDFVAGDSAAGHEAAAHYVALPYHEDVLGQLVFFHSLARPLIGTVLGPRGSAKSVLAKRLAGVLHYAAFFFPLHRDVTSNDLLMRRATKPNGDTVWLPSPLLTACLRGGLCVLDGVDSVPASTLASLASLLHDGEIALPDGTRVSPRHPDASRVTHPNFRVVCLGRSETATSRSGTGYWLTQDVLAALGPFVYLRPLDLAEEARVLEHFYPRRQPSAGAAEQVAKLLALAHHLRERDDDEARALAGNLSTRQLVRISSRLVAEEDGQQQREAHVGLLVENACLFRFLPALARDVLHVAMLHVGMALPERRAPADSLRTLVEPLPRPLSTGGGRTQVAWLVIGSRSRSPIYEPRSEEERSLVPDSACREARARAAPCD